MVPPAVKNDTKVVEGKMFAILSYLSILCIIPLLFKKDNEFVLSHGKQGLVIFVGQVAVFIAHIALGTGILRLGIFLLGILSLWGIVEVLRGRDTRLPLVADIADKITL